MNPNGLWFGLLMIGGVLAISIGLPLFVVWLADRVERPKKPKHPCPRCGKGTPKVAHFCPACGFLLVNWWKVQDWLINQRQINEERRRTAKALAEAKPGAVVMLPAGGKGEMSWLKNARYRDQPLTDHDRELLEAWERHRQLAPWFQTAKIK